MVTEFRRLIFSTAELSFAVKVFSREKSPVSPDGEIVAFEMIDKPNIRARIRVAHEGAIADQEVVLDSSYLGAAMLHHCRRNQIPVPKAVAKVVESVADGLALSFSVNANPHAFLWEDNRPKEATDQRGNS